MDIDALFTTQDPHELRVRALTLLEAQAHYIQALEDALKAGRRWRFGRKSEAFQGEQRSLAEEDVDADTADLEQQLAAVLPAGKVPPATPPEQGSLTAAN